MNVDYEPWMQDWPVEISDGSRIEEFLRNCENELGDEHGPVMAEVLLVSLNDAFERDQPSKEVLDRAANVLRKYPDLLDYWRCSDSGAGEETFAITPWIRSL